MIFASLTQIFFVIGLPLVAVLAVVTSIFLCHHYQTIIQSTASGGQRVNWTGDTFVDMLWKVPYIYWLLACANGIAFIIAGLLAKHVGIASAILPLISLWLIFPIVQLSSLYSSSIWIPLSPLAFSKMAGKASAVMIFYMLSAFAIIAFGVGAYLCLTPTPLKVPGIFIGAFLMAMAIFAYARALGRLAFVCSFVGVQETVINEELPQYSAEKRVERTKKKKPKKAFKQPSQMKPLATPDAEDGVGYNVSFQDDPPETPPEDEKEFVPPKFAWDDPDEDATPYTALKPEVEIKKVVDPKITEAKESELKLLRRDDEVREPKEAWPPEVLTEFLADKETWSQLGIAIVLFSVDGIVAMIMWSFL